MDNNGIFVGIAKALTKPATLLIEKLSVGCWKLFEPVYLVNMAKANAASEMIEVQNNIEVKDLQKRAVERWIKEETAKQLNLEEITKKAFPMLNENADPSRISDDWAHNFIDKCKYVSDSDMQEKWARILASEANTPGSYSRRALNILSEFSKEDAILMETLSCFCDTSSRLIPLIFYDGTDNIYSERGLNLMSLGNLESLGVIQFESPLGFIKTGFSSPVTINYGSRHFSIQPKDGSIELGNVLMTNPGNELLKLCTPVRIEGFEEFLVNKYKSKGFTIL